MKRLILTTILAIAYLASVAQFQQTSINSVDADVTLNSRFSKAAKLDSILKNYAPGILTGASIAVYSEAEGWWAGAAGFADVKQKTPMNNQHLQYLQSVAKMYMAVEILQLKEEGKIDLDQPMTKYLPARFSQYIKDGDKVSVRHLLNHTSGIAEYNEDPEFLSEVVLHPLKNFPSMRCVQTLAGKELEWVPGSKYKYVNTNYMLLALIGDALTGDHAEYIRQHIFKPLNLRNSYYGNSYTYLKGLNLPESYWDVFNNGIPVNVTPLQQMTVICSKGDDGIVCTTVDAIQFLKGLMEGKLLKPESMKEMMDFVKDEKGNKRYGMGMIYFDLGGLPAYGHGGGGIGAGCGLLYIPSHKTYTFFATNTGVFSDGKLGDKAGEMRNAILQALLQ
jgi:D-alanyl-D-alanine carboxypeptidase